MEIKDLVVYYMLEGNSVLMPYLPKSKANKNFGFDTKDGFRTGETDSENCCGLNGGCSMF